MINASDIDLDYYNYDLPDNKIAYYPTLSRSESKLLLVNRQSHHLEHHHFSNLCELLPQDSLLVRNSTKVISARLYFRKPGGAIVELLLINPVSPSIDPQITMQSYTTCTWECIVGGRSVREGMILNIASELSSPNKISAEILTRHSNKAKVQFNWTDENITFSQLLQTHGKVPLPPYIKRQIEKEDIERYQTVYAIADGSVAAPTAGLHFTDNIIQTLTNRGVSICDLILHVGPGTFIPISDDKVDSHKMHSEQFFVGLDQLIQIKNAIRHKKPIIAVGTTSVRTLESLYWLGVKITSNEKIDLKNVNIQQWEPYTQISKVSPFDAISNLLERVSVSELDSISGSTSLFIIPGYQFRVISGMLTNFHQPKSTLILLVASFLGRNLWKKAYDEALNSDYRFLSYGDSSLLL